MSRRVAAVVVRRPKAVIAAWVALFALLALVGTGVEGRLHRSDLVIGGTPSATALKRAQAGFGPSSQLVVLLRGPHAAVRAQAATVGKRLERRRDTDVLAPVDARSGRPLTARSGAAMLVVRVSGPFERVSRDAVPEIRAAVRQTVHAPVRAAVTGYADIAAGIHRDSIDAIQRAELLAAPLLLLVLLLVFRSPVAAAIPLIVGIGTIAAATGVLSLVNELLDLDAVALNLASMMGLALGVDYSLLLVSRFREELAAGRPAAQAAVNAAGTAGHTVFVAGTVLVAAMIAATFVAPGGLLASGSSGVIVGVLLGLCSALTVVPALLALLGPRIDRWRLGRARGGGSAVAGLALRAIRRPGLAAGAVLVLIGALMIPALDLQSGAPDPRVLPSSSVERRDFDALGKATGDAWAAPYEVILTLPRGTLAEPRRLAAIERWERRVARLPGVTAVLGPGRLRPAARRLAAVPATLRTVDRTVRDATHDQRRLAGGLQRAGAGAQELRAGLAGAAAGAGRLQRGGSQAADGARAVSAGLARARAGVRRLGDGLSAARRGARALARGASAATDGTARLLTGLRDARSGSAEAAPGARALARGLRSGAGELERLREPAQRADRELATALQELDRMLPTSKADPAYRRLATAVGTAAAAVSGRDPRTGAPVAQGYAGLDAALAEAVRQTGAAADGAGRLAGGIATLDRGLRRLLAGARDLDAGAGELENGAGRLAGGLYRLSVGGDDLAAGLHRLQRGSSALSGGLAQLDDGAAALERGLADGRRRSGGLTGGLDRMQRGVSAAAGDASALRRQLGQSGRLTGVLRSGFTVLGALETAPRAQRTSAGFAINAERGGAVARITVLGRGEVASAGHPLRAVLERDLPSLARATGAEATLGGAATLLQDFDAETSGRLAALIISLSLVTFLVLAALLRSLLVPLIAVLLNLLTAGAAFGVLVLLFQGSAPLGGPGFLDAITVAGVFSVVFALSIDYAVFLLGRMREEYDRSGDADAAIAAGLRRTAGVVTGAALIMTGVFCAFATAEVSNMRQLGVGLTVAVVLDATVIRLILLPAAIRLCGRAAWWLPRALRRPPVPVPSG